MTIRRCCPWHLKLAELGKADDNGEPVNKTEHYRRRHKADKLAEFENTRPNLQQAHQHNSGEQILHPMVSHQRYHNHSERARCTRDHARPPPENRGD